MLKTIITITFLLVTLIDSLPQSAGIINYFQGNIINDLLIKGDTAWISCNNGLFITANLSGKTFTRTYLLEEELDFDVNAIAIDQAGVKWFATDRGLFQMENDSIFHYPASDLMDSDTITTVAIDQDNTVWIGTNTNYIIRLSGSGIEPYKIAEGNNRIFSIKVDSKNIKWIGVSGDNSGIYAFSQSVIDTLKFDSFGMKNSSIVIDDFDQVWVASGKDFVGMYDGTEIVHFDAKNDIIGNNITSIYSDTNNNIWTFNRNFGISYYNGIEWTSLTNNILELFLELDLSVDNWTLGNKSQFIGDDIIEGDSLIYLLQNTNVYDILFVYDTIWICTSKGYLIKAYPTTKTYELVKLLEGFDTHLYSIAIDSSRTKWITSCQGVFEYDGKDITKYDTNDGLAFDCVATVAVDHNNRKWFGSEAINEVSVFNDSIWETIQIPDGAWAYSIKVDSNNNKWIGGGSPGVIVLNDKDSLISTIGLTNFSYGNNSLLIDQFNNKWFATNASHAYGYIDDSLYIFDENDGLINNTITSFHEDRNGNIWVVDYNNSYNISFFNRAEWTTYPFGLLEILLQTELRNTNNWTSVPLNQDLEDLVKIYPNPAHDILIVKLQPILLNCRLKIYTSDGKLIKTGVVDSELMKINLNNIEPGLYVICIYHNSSIISKKIIVK